MTKLISLAQQIEEVEHKLKLRESVYPGRIRTAKMRAGEAEFHIARIRAVLATLRWLQANEAVVRAAQPGDQTCDRHGAQVSFAGSLDCTCVCGNRRTNLVRGGLTRLFSARGQVRAANFAGQAAERDTLK
jgi:hypothetical protein